MVKFKAVLCIGVVDFCTILGVPFGFRNSKCSKTLNKEIVASVYVYEVIKEVHSVVSDMIVKVESVKVDIFAWEIACYIKYVCPVVLIL